MLTKLFLIYIYLQSIFCGCGPNRRESGFERPGFKRKLEIIGKLNEQVVESSGLAHGSDNSLWTHNDGDNPSELYKVSPEGNLLQTLPLALENTDWEELAEDEQHLYIGDFGNNANARRNLRIYKLSKQDYSLTGTIFFSFEDQDSFPPAKDELHFDLEAFFHYQDSLYLFTKSRGKNKKLKLYTLPASPGEHIAKPKEQLPINTMITAADVSPAGDQFAVLGYGRLFLFNVTNGHINLSGKRYCIPLSRTGQAEAILYTAPNQLLITNEKGRIYKLTLKQQ